MHVCTREESVISETNETRVGNEDGLFINLPASLKRCTRMDAT